MDQLSFLQALEPKRPEAPANPLDRMRDENYQPADIVARLRAMNESKRDER